MTLPEETKASKSVTILEERTTLLGDQKDEAHISSTVYKNRRDIARPFALPGKYSLGSPDANPANIPVQKPPSLQSAAEGCLGSSIL